MMRTWIAGSLALGLIFSTVPVNAIEKKEAIRPATLAKAKEVPAFSKQAGSALTGRFDSKGLAVWYFDAKDFVAKGTHFEFELDYNTYGTMFASKADAEAGRVYNRYYQVTDDTLYFPLSWSGRQYLVLEGYPGDRYSVPAYISRYEPIEESMTAAVQSVKPALLVQTRPGAMRAQAFGALKVESVASELRIERLVYASYAEAKAAQQKFERSSAVAFAEFDAPIQAFGVDAYQKYQWSLQNTGQKKGLKGADIGFVAMQKRIKGKKLSATKVAVLDSGINPSYADFAGKIRMDLGYDFINGDKSAWDDNGHGSHVAGVIAAGGNNTYGMTGINPMATLIPIKVLDDSGAGSVSGLVKGIQHATKQGARVINMSLGGNSSSKSIESALAAAVKKNILIIAASGNEGRGTIAYPARSKYVLSVGATGRKDTKASFSNYGTGLDLVAPGVSIPSYLADGELLYGSGTSMATPHVAGVASLLISLKPSLKASSVESILKKSAKDLGKKGYDTSYGAGRLNADSAVKLIP